MISVRKTLGKRWPMMLAAAGLLLAAAPALAAEDPNTWRATYDLIMRWVNFLILAGVLFKFGRRPLMGFLRNQKEEVESRIQALEAKKQAAEARLQETRESLAHSEEKFAKIKERVETEGLRRKEEIIADAHQESSHMLTNASRRNEARITEEIRRIRSELIDMALNLAQERLPQLMTPEDSQRWVDRYIDGI